MDATPGKLSLKHKYVKKILAVKANGLTDGFSICLAHHPCTFHPILILAALWWLLRPYPLVVCFTATFSVHPVTAAAGATMVQQERVT